MSGGHYPAPYKIIDAARTGLEKGLVEGYEAEAQVGVWVRWEGVWVRLDSVERRVCG